MKIMAGITHEVEDKNIIEAIKNDAAAAADELVKEANLKKGQIVVIGCSTSETLGEGIGSWSVPEAGEAIYDGIMSVFAEKGIYIAAQCCEHLNRSLVLEEEAVDRYGFNEVTVRPMPHAGGALGTAAYEGFAEPVVVETIVAHLGLDIGQTLIGMHLKRVAVPVRLKHKCIGEAILTAARTRPPLVGGERAKYPGQIR